jgi:hypothetical protein
MTPVIARLEPSLGARVVKRTPLLYSRGPDARLGRPAHVRAGSAIVRAAGNRLIVVQDDALFFAVVDPATGVVADLPLPADDGVRLFDDTRGNKSAKLDLEASVQLRGGTLIVAFGSGSTAERERVVLVSDPPPRIVHARRLYEALRSAKDFSGTELNIEGTACAGDDILFFNRGNGAGAAVNATGRVQDEGLARYLLELTTNPDAPSPALREIVQWELGDAEGTRLTFTDGARTGGAAAAFLACAEDCPDATHDGVVKGVSIGRLDDRKRWCAMAPILDENGAPLRDKAEGLAFDEADVLRAFVVVDKDDPDVPADLLELKLEAGWAK